MIIGTAVASGIASVAASAIGGAVAQAPVEQAQVVAPHADTEFQLRDRQQLKGYFLDRSGDRLR